MQLQEFEVVPPELEALNARVRAVTAQHGDIPGELAKRNCGLEFVALVSDPSFLICKDYTTKHHFPSNFVPSLD